MYKGFNFSTPSTTLGIFCLSYYSYPSGYKVASEFHFLMTNDPEHRFTYLLTLCTFSLEKYLFKFFGYFSNGWFVFMLLSCKSSL